MNLPIGIFTWYFLLQYLVAADASTRGAFAGGVLCGRRRTGGLAVPYHALVATAHLHFEVLDGFLRSRHVAESTARITSMPTARMAGYPGVGHGGIGGQQLALFLRLWGQQLALLFTLFVVFHDAAVVARVGVGETSCL